jgi:hypothetical protein
MESKSIRVGNKVFKFDIAGANSLESFLKEISQRKLESKDNLEIGNDIEDRASELLEGVKKDVLTEDDVKTIINKLGTVNEMFPLKKSSTANTFLKVLIIVLAVMLLICGGCSGAMIYVGGSIANGFKEVITSPFTIFEKVTDKMFNRFDDSVDKQMDNYNQQVDKNQEIFNNQVNQQNKIINDYNNTSADQFNKNSEELLKQFQNSVNNQ